MARGGWYSTVLRQITSDPAALRQITGRSRRTAASDAADGMNPNDRGSTLESPKAETRSHFKINAPTTEQLLSHGLLNEGARYLPPNF
jgi:hypothetical protein